MSNQIILKHSGVPYKVPKYLALGELAVNAEDGVIFFRSPSGEMHQIKSLQPNLMDGVNRWLVFFLAMFWMSATAVLFIEKIFT